MISLEFLCYSLVLEEVFYLQLLNINKQIACPCSLQW